MNYWILSASIKRAWIYTAIISRKQVDRWEFFIENTDEKKFSHTLCRLFYQTLITNMKIVTSSVVRLEVMIMS
jgi:hypothetical protein